MKWLNYFFLAKYNGRIQGISLNVPKLQDPFLIPSAKGHVEKVSPALVAWALVAALKDLH